MVNAVKARTKGFAKKPFKLVQSEERQINSFLDYQGSLLASLGCPRNAIKSYIGTLRTRIYSERAGFLKQLKDLFIQGVKILGGDPPIFSGWKMKGSFPRLYHWVFTELATLHLNWDGSPSQACRCRGLLSVLYGARALKLRHSVSALNKALSGFKNRVTKVGYSLSDVDVYQDMLEKLKRRFGPISDRQKFPLGARFDLSRRSLKPNQLWKNEEFRMPTSVFETQRSSVAFDNAIYMSTGDLSDNAFVKDGPIGKVCVLTEKAGKTRVICGYNGYVNSSDLYTRCRSILDVTPEDASKDQALGHMKARTLSAIARHRTEKSYVPLIRSTPMFRTQPATSALTIFGFKLFSSVDKKSTVIAEQTSLPVLLGKKILSADLTAFTDSIGKGAWRAALQFLNCSNMDDLLFGSEVVLPTGEAIKVSSLLMGMKGCFDMASLIHHATLPIEADYSIVGDDFVGVIPPEVYESLVGTVGLELNRSKTVYSEDTCVFCGKVFKTGIDISPYVPSFYTMCGSSTESSVAAAKDALDRGYLFPLQFRSIVRFVKTEVLPRLKGIRVSFELPSKLGGFCTRDGPHRSILDVLNEPWQRLIASVSVPRSSDPIESISRNACPGFPMSGIKVLDWTELYVEGGQKLPKTFKRLTAKQRSYKFLGLGDILEYYYGLIPAVPE